jgi:hypothetical protein
MKIERNFELSAVKDFRTNVEPLLSGNRLAEEIYDNGKLVGWKIIRIA